MTGQRIVLASGNRHKVDELRRLVAQQGQLAPQGPPAEVIGLDAFSNVPEIEESAPDFAGNAKLKAFAIADWLAEQGEPGTSWVLADDSGICIDALAGKPGVRSARFAGEPSDDAANNAKLVEELQRLGLDRSPAHYVCALALVRVDGGPLPDGRAHAVFDGRWDVEVRTVARGTGGFGYDPHAWLAGGARTVAELSHDEKATASHRGAAFAALVAWWQVYGGAHAG